MTLQQLRYFLAACRHGSFTAAAEAMYVAQPSLAEQIRRLEQEVGVRLFVRTGRRLELTEAGSNLKMHSERVMAAMDAAEASLQSARSLRGGTASLGTFGVSQRYLVKEVVSTFVARHPEVTVRVIGQHSSEVIEQVRSGTLEAGLVTLPVQEPSLVVEPVMSDEVLYTALPGPDTERPMSIERLAQVRLIAWPAVVGWRDSIRRQIKAWGDEAGVAVTASVEVEHVDSALELAAMGLGGTYVLRTIADSTSGPPELVAVPFERPLYDTYGFIWRREHPLSPATAELVRLARRHMESYGRPVRL
ncbi:MAG TPA: LysR family transcriptional regulator [Solirubrobacteraceae bacterium]|jgi:DNA-binding transcriptional LysR family regulator|nr:LysR family transcriptional regulator [Solirubrobacteraceae bacterium]